MTYDYLLRLLTDNHNRPITYLRLAVTDRCNLRCFYCMPEEGIDWLGRKELMSYEEMVRICAVLAANGVNKIRITGGEPFVRKDIMSLLSTLAATPGVDELTLTTNGILTASYIPELKRLGIRSVNLSLDTLDRNRFFAITRRDELPAVLHTMETLLAHGIQVKINAVVMDGRNTQDIADLVALTRDLPVSMRFIEEMPFNGTGELRPLLWDHLKILEAIRAAYPGIQKAADPAHSTSFNYQIPGHKGDVGIIAAYTRSFCGTCNRIRITPQGMLKTCLYDGGVVNLRDLLRSGATDAQLLATLQDAISHRARNGHEAEQNATHESMAAIGG
ncbi:MAG: GTP 3',8-cyclase MoaA [Taibaiella sp.]|nr:GTP 3',8-cyclase MoaA [Taibaiella sp.]